MVPPPRVASLLPSATEIVCALGAEESLVGVSHECDYPDTLGERPVLTQARVEDHGSSRAIDEAVRRIVRDALSVYTVDHALLGSLEPTIVITQDLCEVCAVSLDDVRAAVARLASAEDVEILSLRPTRLGGILDDIDRVAAALKRPRAGAEVRSALNARIDAVRSRAQAAKLRPRVASLEWIDPIMLGGTWMPEVIDIAGGVAVGVEVGRPAPTVTADELCALQPDVVVVKACGFSLGRTLEERDLLEATVLSGLPGTTRVYLTDGNAFFNRPGPRIVDSIEIMAACLHPDLFGDFGSKYTDAIFQMR
ncbi:MAG: ABC transporter substrate-binding protein [Myxococcota bacterium]